MTNKELYNAIRGLVFSIKNEDDKTNTIHSPKTILNSILRYYNAPRKHCFVSKKAKEIHDNLTSKTICWNDLDYGFPADKLSSIKTFNIYFGNNTETTKYTLKPNEHVKGHYFFMQEHIVPISIIMQNLLNYKKLTDKDIQKELNKIRVCWLSKDEDRLIGKTNKKWVSQRPDNYKKVIDTIYKKVGIETLPLKV